jgi:hypothetical protein
MWLPGMKAKDEKGRPIGLLAFQPFDSKLLILSIKLLACGSSLCDDIGPGKPLCLSVGQALHNHSKLLCLLMEATPNTDGARTDTHGNIHRGKGQTGHCHSQDAIKRTFSIYCSYWRSSLANFPVHEGPVLNDMPSQIIWN